MRRDPYLRPENLLAGGLDDIERLKEALSKISDGRGLVISPGSAPGSTTPPFETSQHVLYGSKHSRALRVSDGGGLNADYGQGQVWTGGTFYDIAAGTLALDDDATNYVYVSFGGAVEFSAVAYPYDCTPLAIVVTASGDITSVSDRRSYLTGAIHSYPPPGTILVEEDDTPVDPQASAIDFVEPDAVLVEVDTPGEVDVYMYLYALLGGRSGGQVLMGGLASGNDITLRGNAVALDGSVFLGSSALFELDEGAGQLKLPTTGSGAGVVIGGDTQLYRSASDVLMLASGDTLAINDANFTLAIVASNPRLIVDATDYLQYNRAANRFEFFIGGGSVIDFTASVLDIDIGSVTIAGDLTFDEAHIITSIRKSRQAAGDQFIDFDITGLTASEDARIRIFRSTSPAGADDRFTIYVPNTSTVAAEVLANTQRFNLPGQGSGAGILLGGDVLLYRSAPDVLYTPDSMTIAGTLLVDTINEETGAAGVTIEGVLLKDSDVIISGSNILELGGDAQFSRYAAGQVLFSGTGASYFAIGDGNFSFNFNNGAPLFINLDSNDYWSFTRSTNTLDFVLGGGSQFTIASNLASFPRGALDVGTDDSLRGILTLYGHGASTDEGGEIRIYLAADHDATFQFWGVDAQQNDLRFFSSDGVVVNAMTAEGQLQLPVVGSGAGLLIGGDAQWYRAAADVMATPDTLRIGADLDHDGSNVGFYGTAPVAQQAGVAVTAAAIHAALVNLGLITA